jgi:hypothetical protein
VCVNPGQSISCKLVSFAFAADVEARSCTKSKGGLKSGICHLIFNTTDLNTMAHRSLLDNIFLFYFLLHIPIAILIDSQAIVQDRKAVFPAFAVKLVDNYVRDFGDFLVGTNPVWFQSLVWAEQLVQLPFFIVAIYAFIKCRNWIRIPALIYGAHVVTVMIPIMAEILWAPHLPTANKLKLVGVYGPWVILPLLLLLKMAFVPLPFGKETKGGPKNKTH